MASTSHEKELSKRLKQISCREASLEDRYLAASEVARSLLPETCFTALELSLESEVPSLPVDTPELEKDFYLRRLVDSLQDILLQSKRGVEERGSARLWALLGIVFNAGRLDVSAVRKKLPKAARRSLQECSHRGQEWSGNELAEALVGLFRGLNVKFCLAGLASVKSWVGLLEVCFSIANSSHNTCKLDTLLEFLLTELAKSVKEVEKWFEPVRETLFFPALKLMEAGSQGRSSSCESIREFLRSVLFNELYMNEFAAFFKRNMGKSEGHWRELMLDKRKESPVVLLFKTMSNALQCEPDDHAIFEGARSVVLGGLPWMFCSCCRLVEDLEQQREQTKKPSLAFCCFVKFIALALPPTHSKVMDKRAVKRKRQNSGMLWDSLQSIGNLLEACSRVGAYDPTHASHAFQMSVLQKIMEDTLAAFEEERSYKWQKRQSSTTKGLSSWEPCAESAVESVIMGMRLVEHQVIHQNIESILCIALMMSSKLKDSGEHFCSGIFLKQILRVYTELRQLDILLDVLLRHVQSGRALCPNAFYGPLIRQLKSSIQHVPPVQRAEVVGNSLKHMSYCTQAISDWGVLGTCEIVSNILDATAVTSSEAVSIAWTCSTGLEEVFQNVLGSEPPLELPVKGSVVLTVGMLRVCSSVISLHQRCEMIDPSISPLNGFSGAGSSPVFSNTECSERTSLSRFVTKCLSSLQYTTWSSGSNINLENVWRKICMDCLLQRIFLVKSAWQRQVCATPGNFLDGGKILNIDGGHEADLGHLPSPYSKDDVQRYPFAQPYSTLMSLMKGMLSTIPMDWFDKIDTQRTLEYPSWTISLFEHDRETICVISWVDLCASFHGWAPHAADSTLTDFLRKLLDFLSQSYRREKSLQHPVELASWELFVCPDTFTHQRLGGLMVESLSSALLAEVLATVGSAVSGNSIWQAFFHSNVEESNKMHMIVKKAIEGISECQDYIVGTQSGCQEIDRIHLLENIVSIGAGIPWESLCHHGNQGLMAGLGACIAISMQSIDTRRSLLHCSVLLTTWIAHACVVGSLDDDQFEFMVSFAIDILGLSTATKSAPETDVIQVLENMGSLGMSHKCPVTLIPLITKAIDLNKSPSHVSCVWSAIAVGPCRWAVENQKGYAKTGGVETIITSVASLEHTCAQHAQQCEEIISGGANPEDMRISEWSFGCLCRAMAACLHFHRCSGISDSMQSPVVSLIPILMGCLCETQSKKSLHALPNYTLMGLIDFTSQMAGVLSCLDPVPDGDVWVSLLHFHLLMIPPLHAGHPVDTFLQTSTLVDSNPMIVLSGDDGSAGNVRQYAVQNISMLFKAASQTGTGVCDMLIETSLDTVRKSQDLEKLYAATQALTAGLSVYLPQSQLLETLPYSLMKMMGKILVSVGESCPNAHQCTCICLILRSMAIMLRKASNTVILPCISDLSKTGTFLFSKQSMRHDVVAGAGPFVECCDIISMIAARHSSYVAQKGASALRMSFHTMLTALVHWCTSASDGILLKCTESINVASGKLVKLHSRIGSLVLGLAVEYIEAVASMKEMTHKRANCAVVEKLFQGCLEVYLATNPQQRKTLHGTMKSSACRLVLSTLGDEVLRHVKYRRKV